MLSSTGTGHCVQVLRSTLLLWIKGLVVVCCCCLVSHCHSRLLSLISAVALSVSSLPSLGHFITISTITLPAILPSLLSYCACHHCRHYCSMCLYIVTVVAPCTSSPSPHCCHLTHFIIIAPCTSSPSPCTPHHYRPVCHITVALRTMLLLPCMPRRCSASRACSSLLQKYR